MNQLTLEKNRLFYYLENIKSENLGFSFSLLLHLLLLLFAIGLPNFFDRQPINIPTIIPIEIINISEVTSIPKKINEIKPAEIQQKKVKEKKFNSSDIQEIQKVDIKEKPIIKIKKNSLANGMNVLDLVLLTPLANSKGEIRRMIKNNGLKINNEVVSDETKIIDQNNFDQDNNMKVSHGKKQHVIIKII